GTEPGTGMAESIVSMDPRWSSRMGMWGFGSTTASPLASLPTLACRRCCGGSNTGRGQLTKGALPSAVAANHDVRPAVDKHDLSAQVGVLLACQPSEQVGS